MIYIFRFGVNNQLSQAEFSSSIVPFRIDHLIEHRAQYLGDTTQRIIRLHLMFKYLSVWRQYNSFSRLRIEELPATHSRMARAAVCAFMPFNAVQGRRHEIVIRRRDLVHHHGCYYRPGKQLFGIDQVDYTNSGHDRCSVRHGQAFTYLHGKGFNPVSFISSAVSRRSPL